jgi:CRP/FNR family transcriptional regulator, cyclic AMP receptor protein
MRVRDEKIAHLSELPPFTTARPRELRDIAAAADIVEVDAGRVLCRADRRALETYVIVSGMVDVVIAGGAVATLRRGQIVGELGVIDGLPRSADVVAATDVTALAFSAPAFRGLIETNHTIRSAVLRQLAERVRTLDHELAEVGDASVA